MGQAFDDRGNVLGSAVGATKKEVFDALMEKHPNAAEIRIKSGGAPPHTKLNPGPYDCYAKLFDDEPYFVLRAKDPDAPGLVEMWSNLRAVRNGLSNPKIEEARGCADAMRAWRRDNAARLAEHEAIKQSFAEERRASAQGDGDSGVIDPDPTQPVDVPDSARPGRRW